MNDEEMEAFAHNCADLPYEEWMSETVRRTDQKARKIMFEGFAKGECADQRKVDRHRSHQRDRGCEVGEQRDEHRDREPPEVRVLDRVVERLRVTDLGQQR